MNKIYIVGIGPGSSDYLTKKAIETVKNSDITVGSERAIELFDEIQKKISFNVKDLVEKLEEAVELAINGLNVSILSTGDPGFSGVLKTVLRIADEKGFNKENIEVIPGISSLQLAAAKNHIQWDMANVMTFHGRENIEDILPIINNGKTTIALPSRKVKDMAQFLLDNKPKAIMKKDSDKTTIFKTIIGNLKKYNDFSYQDYQANLALLETYLKTLNGKIKDKKWKEYIDKLPAEEKQDDDYKEKLLKAIKIFDKIIITMILYCAFKWRFENFQIFSQKQNYGFYLNEKRNCDAIFSGDKEWKQELPLTDNPAKGSLEKKVNKLRQSQNVDDFIKNADILEKDLGKLEDNNLRIRLKNIICDRRIEILSKMKTVNNFNKKIILSCLEGLFVFDKELNGKDDETTIRRQRAINDFLYYPNGQVKTEVLENLVREVDSPKKEILDVSSYKVKSKTGTTHRMMTVIFNNMRLGLETGRGYVDGDKDIEICNKFLEKEGFNKDQVYHISMTASQANGLESTGIHHAELGDYLFDSTQGPTACSKAMPLLLKRELEFGKGTLTNIDAFKPLIDILYNWGVIWQLPERSPNGVGTWIPIERYYSYVDANSGLAQPQRNKIYQQYFVFTPHVSPNYLYPLYRNGYIQPNSLTLDGQKLLLQALQVLKQRGYVSQEGKEATKDGSDLTQNFASAMCYQGFKKGSLVVYNQYDPQNPQHPQHAQYQGLMNAYKLLMNFNWVYPQYNNIIKDAIRKSALLHDKELIMVHLTRIGQGAFYNPVGIPELSIAIAVLENYDKLNGSNILIQKEWDSTHDLTNAWQCISTMLEINKTERIQCVGEPCCQLLDRLYTTGGREDSYLFNNRTIFINRK